MEEDPQEEGLLSGELSAQLGVGSYNDQDELIVTKGKKQRVKHQQNEKHSNKRAAATEAAEIANRLKKSSKRMTKKMLQLQNRKDKESHRFSTTHSSRLSFLH